MKRRDFTCAAASLLALPAAWAQSVPLTAGENYKANYQDRKSVV